MQLRPRILVQRRSGFRPPVHHSLFNVSDPPAKTAADLRRRNLYVGRRLLLLGALVVDDREREEVSVATDGEDVLVVEAAGQLSDRPVVVVVH